MNCGCSAGSQRALRMSRMATFRTASTTNTPGQTASSSSSLLTSRPGRSARYCNSAKGFGKRGTRLSPCQRHPPSRSSRNGPNGIAGATGWILPHSYQALMTCSRKRLYNLRMHITNTNCGTSHAIVIGGSMAGLITARVLAEHFGTVTIVERDRLPVQPSPRPGVPQAAHQHVLLLRGLHLVERWFPGVRDELTALGAPCIDMAADMAWLTAAGWGVRFQSDLNMLTCSRDLLEWVLRRRLADFQRRSVHRRRGCLRAGAQARRGCRDPAESPQGAGRPPWKSTRQLVVDASGRHSRMPEWLSQIGFESPRDCVVDGHLGYASRVYRIADVPRFPLAWRVCATRAPDASTRGRHLSARGQQMARHAGWNGRRLSTHRRLRFPRVC